MAAPIPGDVIRVLCISSDDPQSQRRAAITTMFDEVLGDRFQLGFSSAVGSRDIRSRAGLMAAARRAGILDPQQHVPALSPSPPPLFGAAAAAVSAAVASQEPQDPPAERDSDAGAVYSHPRGYPASSVSEDNLWWLCKTLNRDRATLACTLAHLAAQRKAVEEGWDLIIEDNVRVVTKGAEESIRAIAAASPDAHLRYYSFNGKSADIARLFGAGGLMDAGSGGGSAAVPFPTAENQQNQPKQAPAAGGGASGSATEGATGTVAVQDTAAAAAATAVRDGGKVAAGGEHVSSYSEIATFNPLIWGTYAYSIGADGHDRLLLSIRADVGTIVWRPKRAKKSHVKGMDRVMPRKLLTLPPGGIVGVPLTATPLSAAAAQSPVFFRGPMLKSMIHPKWDHESCETVQYQLTATGRGWGDLWLTEAEKIVVAHHALAGEWLHPDEIAAAMEGHGDVGNGGGSNGGTVTATDAGLSQVTAGVTAIAATITAAAPAPAPTPAPVEDHQLTVIVITSAILSHPNPEMVLKVVESIEQVNFGGTVMPQLLLVGDGVEQGSSYHPKKGKVPADVLANYIVYLDTLDTIIKSAPKGSLWANGRVLRLPGRVGFGHAVKAALLNTTTEYVMIVQHDHALNRGFDMPEVLAFMTAHNATYVNLPKSSTFKHLNRCKSDYKINVRLKAIDFGVNNSTFIPMLFWYDGPHLARRMTYLSLVFDGESPLPKGHFIEDTFGHQMMDELRSNYDERFKSKYNSYAYIIDKDNEEAFVYHLDGRKYVADAERVVKGWQENSSLATKEERLGRVKWGQPYQPKVCKAKVDSERGDGVGDDDGGDGGDDIVLGVDDL